MIQAIEIIRLLGLGGALRVKHRFDKALPYVRGYAACSCLWALLETGVLDRLLASESVGVEDLVREGGLEPHVLESVLEYLDGLGLVRVEAGRALRHAETQGPHGRTSRILRVDVCL